MNFVVSPRHFILGTAGHIDHGKTALVKALTGVDTDRLPEEKARGLTIDIGFAHYGEQATIIDVPGHEKFVKNMVAGVSTIDLVLFVIAADDGIMPQTREHLEILELLQIRHGIIVITKKDLVDEEWLQLLGEEVRQFTRGTFLERAPLIFVSSSTGEGLADLKETIRVILEALPQRPDRGVFWLPVDRAFTMKGFGTIVTGSVISGEAAVGDVLEILPTKKMVRVRGLQRHGKTVQAVRTGDRAAMNVQGIATDDVARGQVLTLASYFAPSQRLNCRIRLLTSAPASLRRRARVRVHLGTVEVLARVAPIGGREISAGDEGYLQLILEKPAAARRLDPLVLRQYSPPRTIGGGVVLDAQAAPLARGRREATMEKLRSLEREEPAELVIAHLLQAGRYLVTLDHLAASTGVRREDLQKIISALQDSGEVLTIGKRGVIHKLRVESLQTKIENLLSEFHEAHPTSIGMRKAELASQAPALSDSALLNFVIESLKAQGAIKEQEAIIALASHDIRLSPAQETLRQQVDDIFYAEAFSTSTPAALAERLRVPKNEIEIVIGVMLSNRELVRVDNDMFFHARRVQEAQDRLIAFLQEHGQITIAQFKDLMDQTSRKYAVPLLQYFDGRGITERSGDVRILGPTEE